MICSVEGFLRPEFDVTMPMDDDVVDFTTVLPLEWAPPDPGRLMNVRLELACATFAGPTRIRNAQRSFDDDGAASYDLALFPEATDPAIDPSIPCRLDLEFTRVDTTPLAPPFGDGQFRTTQSRTVEGVVVEF